jgi:hypothetical protein
VALDDVFGQAQNLDPDDTQFTHLKKEGHIILQPQPSDSPNDPLNWSPKHKYLLASLLITTMVTVGATHSMLTTGYRKLAGVRAPSVTRKGTERSGAIRNRSESSQVAQGVSNLSESQLPRG